MVILVMVMTLTDLALGREDDILAAGILAAGILAAGLAAG